MNSSPQLSSCSVYIIDFGCYYHECFLRDLPDLTCLIRRLPTNLGKSTPYVEGEPNFYLVSEEYPLPPPPRGASWRRTTSNSTSDDAARGSRAVSVKKIGTRPSRVMPASIDAPTPPAATPSSGCGQNADAVGPMSSSVASSLHTKHCDESADATSSPMSSISSDVANRKRRRNMPSIGGAAPSSTHESTSAPRLVARASTEPMAASAPTMPLNLYRNPSAPYYYPTSRHPPPPGGYQQHHPQYPPPRYHFGMYDQYASGWVDDPNQQRGGYHHPAADHLRQPLFHYPPQGMPTNGEYPPSRYSEYNNEYNPQFGYVHRNGGIGTTCTRRPSPLV